MLSKLKKHEINYDLIINYLLIAYALSLPISKAGVNIFETLILLIWFIQGNWSKKLSQYRENKFLISMILFLILHIISIPLATSSEFALDYIAKYRHFFIIFPIYSSLNLKYLKYIFSAFLISMLLSEVISYGIFFEIWHYKNILPTNPAPFMDRVSYSVLLSFTAILLLTRFLNSKEDSIFLRATYLLFFISSTTNLFINGGRTGQTTFIILVFLSFILSYKNKFMATVIAFITSSAILILSYNYSPNFEYRVDLASYDIQQMIYEDNFTSDGLSVRISLWTVGFDNFMDNFLLGKGIGNAMNDVSYYAEERSFDSQFISNYGDVHNMFLIVALQLGILGLLSFIYIFYRLLYLKFINNTDHILNLTFTIGFILWSMGNTTFHTMNPMTYFALFSGIFATLSFRDSQQHSS